ncbi:MAG: translocase [Planctomycetales bacterium]|nr:translocase [Planctomycetales bacterium]
MLPAHLVLRSVQPQIERMRRALGLAQGGSGAIDQRDRRCLELIHQQALILPAKRDRDLVHEADRLRELAGGNTEALDDERLASAFALVREAARRTLGWQHYDVQMLAGLAMSRGDLVEMATGEGKTLSVTAPAFVASLVGGGVHLATTNEYLAERDFEAMRPVYELLGCRVGWIHEGQPADEKRGAYRADITYGSGCEFGFDYLRDRVATRELEPHSLGDQVRKALRGEPDEKYRTLQRRLTYSLIDEVDSVLIDEARTPLVLAGASSAPPATELYLLADHVARQLRPGEHWQASESGNPWLTVAGALVAQAALTKREPPPLGRAWIRYVENALHAAYLLQRDVSYVVHDHKVLIVDEYTGRIMPERSWNDGLHQAVEAKEDVPITPEKQSLARITRQRFYQLYKSLTGMSGTIAENEREIHEFYGRRVVRVPTHRPVLRSQLPTRAFANQEAKLDCVAHEVAVAHRRGRPVLIGTRTILNSLLVADRLDSMKIPYTLLNGTQDREEAEIVATAGQRGSVVIATNMAGRGTDIRLAPGVAELGGLHVIGLEHHESARIDRQLAGRAGRQGDRGSCQFFASADDPLLRVHAPRLCDRLRRAAGRTGEATLPLAGPIARLQTRLEAAALEARRGLREREAFDEQLLHHAFGE